MATLARVVRSALRSPLSSFPSSSSLLLRSDLAAVRPACCVSAPAAVSPLSSSLEVRRWMCASSKPSADAAAPGDAGGPGAAAEEPSAVLNAEAQLRIEVSELKDNLEDMKVERLRLLADMENVRAIARRDVETSKNFAISSFAKQLLDVSDTLGLAVDSVPPAALADESATALRSLHEGVSMTRHALQKLFSKNGIIEFGVVGEKFDADRHEVLFEHHHDDIDHGHVSSVIKSGFMLKERVLRVAKVGTVKKAQ